MLEAIRDVHEETGRVVGFKPAGGIRNAKQAIQHLVLVHETLGPDWLTPDLLPHRRLVAPQRRAHADPQGEDRRATRARTTSPLTDDRDATRTAAPVADGLDVRARARVARHRHARASATASSSAASGSSRRETYTTISPRDEEPLAEVGAGERGGRRRRRRRRARRVRERLVDAARLRAREVPLPHRAHPPGARARVRGARVAERRQADQGVARRRPAARGRALLLLRGLGRQARVRVPEPHAEAARRRRPDHPVELPAADARVEDRAGARLPATPSC